MTGLILTSAASLRRVSKDGRSGARRARGHLLRRALKGAP